MKFLSRSLAETEQKAQEFIDSLPQESASATVVGLSGDLGSGKTTFVQAVAKRLGVTDSITSPTFVIEKIYAIPASASVPFKKLIHIDAYRLEKGDELAQLAWNETVQDPHNLVLIEWPEKVQDILPPEIRILTFAFVDEHVRQIEL